MPLSLLVNGSAWWCAWICGLCLWLWSLASWAAPITELRIPKPRSEFDIAHDYYVNLLRKALVKGANARVVPRLRETLEMEQGRAVQELQKGRLIDIYWIGTDSLKEEQLLAIPIPLERGLMGFRKFTIHRDNRARFDRVYSLADLLPFTACQATHWPDTKILMEAGLKVLTSPVYENLFRQTAAKRCDYFPRGYHEGAAELVQRKALYPMLMRYEPLMLHYPFAVYFFVHKDNQAMADWLRLGLERMIDDGELLAHMHTHPLTAHVFPLYKPGQPAVRWVNLDNPLLSPATDIKNRRYWFQPDEFRAPDGPLNQQQVLDDESRELVP